MLLVIVIGLCLNRYMCSIGLICWTVPVLVSGFMVGAKIATTMLIWLPLKGTRAPQMDNGASFDTVLPPRITTATTTITKTTTPTVAAADVKTN